MAQNNAVPSYWDGVVAGENNIIMRRENSDVRRCVDHPSFRITV